MAASDEDWVVVKHFDDAMAADVTLNFLRDHEVTAAFRGNSGATGVLTRFTTVLDIRVVVPRSELERALEVLAAMDSPEPDAPDAPPEHAAEAEAPTAGPYRAVRAAASDGDEALSRDRRSRSGPIVMAFVVPGGGHFYARHNRAGLLICVGILALFVGAVLSGEAALLFAALTLAACDAVLGVAAVGRYNRGQVMGGGAQTAVAAVAMLASVGVGFGLVATGVGTRPHHARPDAQSPEPSDTRPW